MENLTTSELQTIKKLIDQKLYNLENWLVELHTSKTKQIERNKQHNKPYDNPILDRNITRKIEQITELKELRKKIYLQSI